MKPAETVPFAARRTGFCRVARLYALLEKLMFGGKLEEARFCHLPHLRDCRDILLLGEGDGRCLARLAKIASQARLHCVDASPAMLARAAARLSAGERARVTFIQADVAQWNPPPAAYDAVVTVFFLDCLTEAVVRNLVAKLSPALRPGARWVWSDFVLPERGPARWRAQIWLRAMYGFFRRSARLTARELPPAEAIFHAAGWRAQARRDFHGIFALGLLLSQPG
ncbi:MAG TPA: class I SAM-dependent methyltransferase [Opitutales bacterium]|nr:class I SAM-dependent methyltransferase [Opitutales bacterium]